MAEPWQFMTDEELRNIARELFKGVDMVRAFESDYDLAIRLLRGVYDRGRSRGVFEASAGARC